MIDITITQYFQLDELISIAMIYVFFLLLHKTRTLSTRLSGTWTWIINPLSTYGGPRELVVLTNAD